MLSREQIIHRAALELAETTRARSEGALAAAACSHAGTTEVIAGPVDVLLLDVTRLSADGAADVPAPAEADRCVGLTLSFDACTTAALEGARLDRLIGPFGVVDVQPEGLVLVEVALNVSARDLQERSTAPLLAGPALRPVRRAAES